MYHKQIQPKNTETIQDIKEPLKATVATADSILEHAGYEGGESLAAQYLLRLLSSAEQLLRVQGEIERLHGMLDQKGAQAMAAIQHGQELQKQLNAERKQYEELLSRNRSHRQDNVQLRGKLDAAAAKAKEQEARLEEANGKLEVLADNQANSIAHVKASRAAIAAELANVITQLEITVRAAQRLGDTITEQAIQ